MTVAVAPPPAASQPAVAKPNQYVIQTGDNYSVLAKKFLGSTKHANLIAKANPGKDPRKLQVGMKINIPPAPPALKDAPVKGVDQGTTPAAPPDPTRKVSEAPPVPTDRAYQVKAGEGWHELAKRFLGDAKRWPELYELNRDRVPRNPEGLQEGAVIELPAGAKPSTRPS
jgi:nucleoid-associated protein YgaU